MYKRRKTLYELKQAPRAWYSHINNYFNESGFKKSKSESTLYVKHHDNVDLLIVALYIDDLILTGSNAKMIKEFKKDMVNKYEMSDMRLYITFLVLSCIKTKKRCSCQKECMLKKFIMIGYNQRLHPFQVNEKLKKEDERKKCGCYSL